MDPLSKRHARTQLIRPDPKPLIALPPPPPDLTISIVETSASTNPTISPSFKVTPVPCSSQPSPSSPSLNSNSEQCLYNVNSRQNIITNDRHEGEEDSYTQATIGNNSLAGKLSNALAESFGQAKKKKLFVEGLYNGHTKLSRMDNEKNEWIEGLKSLFKFILSMRQGLIVMITPFLLMPLLINERKEYKCAFCVGIMAVYWTTEVMPLAVTALLPVVLFPLTGILSPRIVSKEFLNDTNFLFIGGLIVATAVEKCDLHERLALRVLTLVGSKPKWIMFGFMVVTAVLSMFISNTATTAMMVPIGESVIQLLIQKPKASTIGIGSNEECRKNLIESGPSHHKMSFQEAPGPPQLKMAKGLMLSICFAANIGGIGTITGTPPNLVMVGMLSTLFPHVESTGIHYLSWMAFAVPLMVLCLLSCWLILMALFIYSSSPSSSNDSGEQSLSRMMRQKYAKLAPMNFSQKAVSICFFSLLALWVGRDPQVVLGFGDLLSIKEFYTDATSAMLIAIMLFILPTELPSFYASEKESAKQVGRLMDWPTMQKRFPWSVVLLLGGGFALAAGVRESGLSTMMGDILSDQLSHSSSTWTLQLIVIGATMMVTNICSNTVTASIFIPIVATLATEAGIHPLSLMLPTTIACSFAFVLPVGSPPNAIAFSSKGKMLKVPDMVLSGLLVSIVTMAIVMVYLSTFTSFIFPNIDTNKTEWLTPTTTSPPESLLFADVVQQLLNDNITSSAKDVLKVV